VAEARKRTRRSAKSAGARMETTTVAYLAEHINEDIERRVTNGARDRGDVSGLRVYRQRVVVEVKDCAKTDLSGWAREAETERVNDEALAGLVVHKRRGVSDPGSQWVHMTLRDLVALINGERPAEKEEA
jgi:hypothetical protein